MADTIIIKHAVGGRVFLDTAKMALSYMLKRSEEDRSWTLEVDAPPAELVEQVLRWKDELNVFLFPDADGAPARKLWFYADEGGVRYEADRRKLLLSGGSFIEYVPSSFGFQS